MYITTNKNVLREILYKTEDIRSISSCNKLLYNICNNRLYYEIIRKKYKEVFESVCREPWKELYIDIIRMIKILKNDYSYTYTFGNVYNQIYLFKKDENIDLDNLLINSAALGELSLVKYSLECGADIHSFNNQALRFAARNGYFEIVKYLVEHGADIHDNNDEAMRWCC